jgi:hypothetical protein
MAFYEIVGVIPVGDCFMPAPGSVRVLIVVRAAGVAPGTGGRIRATLCQGMLIHMSFMDAVEMPIMQIIDMTFVFDRSVTAARAMGMWVLIVGLMVAHLFVPPCNCRSDFQVAISVNIFLGRV